MKYIITEEQSRLLFESNHLMWVSRRANKEALSPYIRESEEYFPTLCQEFDYAYEYMDAVIMNGVNDFLETQDEIVSDKQLDEVNDIIMGMCEKWFGDELKEVYRMTCEEYNK